MLTLSPAQHQVAQDCHDTFLKLGWSPTVAIPGLLAMALGESSLHPDAAGDKVNGVPTAFGLYQEHGNRCDAIRHATGIDMRHASAADQCRGVNWELHHAESVAGAHLLHAKTAAEAAEVLVRYFERPRDVAGGIAKRVPYALAFAAMFAPATKNPAG